ncbi:MAG: tRNA (N6-threonylcarbamoyladenosine(37)-N6)-methyltransferase TrmO [Vibrio sp.]
MLANYPLAAIGVIHSPYQEKFAIPRQPRLAPNVISSIALQGDINTPESVRGLTEFSHIWLLFLFDQNIAAGWKPTVRPPRLGGNQRIGVLASRATFRPNHIGMSAVELVGVRHEKGQVWIDVRGADLMNGTPIIDIKPYIPYSDAITNANGGYADEVPQTLPVIFSQQAQLELAKHQDGQQVRSVIEDVLAQDPRPSYKKGKTDDKIYAVHLFDLNVCFQLTDEMIQVTAIDKVK